MKSGFEINLERILEEKFFQDSFLRFSVGTKNVLLKQLKDWYLPLFVSSFYFPQISIGDTFLVDKIIRSFLLYISKIEQKIKEKYFSHIEILGDIHPNEIIKVKTINDSIVYPAQFDCDSFIPESLNKIDEKFLNYFVKPINQNGYFFRDFILPSNDFKNKKDISEFYFNFGKIIPFLLFFRTVDQHIENVICNKQYPVFFDLETYAVPELLDEKYSIFNTGLITESKDINIGSLDGESGKIKSYFVPILEFEGNNPKLKWVSKCKKHYFNRPTLNDGRVFLRDFLHHIVNGFEEGTKLLNKNKNFLLKETKSSNAYTRIILRPTSIYFILQQKVFFPHIFLQKGFSLENFFILELKENKIYIQCNIDMDALLKYEVDSLLNGQIPVFYMKINDNLIYDAFRNVIGITNKKPSDYIIDQSCFLDSFLSETLENIKKSV